MSEGQVSYTRDGVVGHILFDRPEARNAVTPAMYAELDAICERIHTEPDLRVVTLRGAGGKSFVSGSDIGQFAAFVSPEDGLDYERRMEKHLAGIAAIPVPTLAILEGFAVGGGLNIAACCDIRIATSGTRFGTPIARGLGNALSATNYARLLGAFGEGRARRMLLLGELLDVEEIRPTGFLTRIVPPEALEDTIAELISQLAANAPLSVRASKTALARLAAQALPDIDDQIRSVYGSADFHGAVAAFLRKSRPVFEGR